MAGLTKIQSDGIGDNCNFDGEGTLVLDSTNNRVGIGTTSPGEDLHVFSSAAAIKIDSSGDGALRFAVSGTNKFSIFQSNNTLRFFDNTNNSERLRIDSNGKLIVNNSAEHGTNARSSWYSFLHINGNSYADTSDGRITLTTDATLSGTAALGSIYFADLNGGDRAAIRGYQDGAGNSTDNFPGALQFWTNSGAASATVKMTITSAGKVGIGTTSPDSYYANDLVVTGSSEGGITIDGPTTGQSYLAFADGTSGNERYRGYIAYNHATDSLKFASAVGERLQIDSAGDATFTGYVGAEGGNAPTGGFHIKDTGGTTRPRITNDASNATVIRAGSATGGVKFNNFANSSELAVIDNSGRLLMGRSSSLNVSGFEPPLQISGANGETSAMLLGRFSNDAGTPTFFFHKSRGTNVDTNTDVQNDDILGRISFYGADGSDYEEAARIQCQVDGTVADGGDATDMPGRLAFFTTPDGDHNAVERMRIHSTGQVGMGTGGTGTGGSSVDVTVRMTPATSGYGIYSSNFSSGTTATPGGYGIYGHMGGTPPSGSAHYGIYGKVDTHSSRSSGGLLAYSINNSVYSILGYWSTAAYYGVYSNGSVYATGGFSSSDSRLKDIVSDGIGTGILDKVCKLQAKRFTWKDNTQQRRSCEDVLIGLLAQDVQTDFPEVVASVHQPKITGVNPETLNEQLGDNLAIDYGKLVPVLVEALKEAKTRIETLEAEVTALKSN